MSPRERLHPLLDGVHGTRSWSGVGRDLCAAGIPIERLAVFLRALHPHVAKLAG